MTTATVPSEDVLTWRRQHDRATLAARATDAEHAMLKLLPLVRGGCPPPDLEVQARRALDAVGLLWEAAYRVNHA